MLSKTWKTLCVIGVTITLSTSLVACGQSETSEIENKTETTKETFKEKAIEIDYSKTPEEILANYTEKGMNDFKVNYPDTQNMYYALKNVGKIAPTIQGKTIDGKEFNLETLKGKKVLVVFSKTTCTVCSDMLPIIDEISKENSDLAIVTIYPVDTTNAVNAYFKDKKIDLPTITLTQSENTKLKELATTSYGIEQVPTYVFIDETGKISYTYIGNKDKTMFQDMINTAYGDEKLYDNVRTVTVQLDENGNEITETSLAATTVDQAEDTTISETTNVSTEQTSTK